MNGTKKYLWWLVITAMLSGSAMIAQEAIDEESLLAMEEMTLTDAVEGDLPSAEADSDDLLAELLAVDEDVEEAGAEPALEESIPLEALELDETVDEDFGDALETVSAEDLADSIEGIEVTDDIDSPVIDEPADMLADVDTTESEEEEPLDLAAAVEELGLPVDEPVVEEVAEEVPAEGDLDDLLGELAEEPVETVEEAPADDLLADLADETPEEPETVEEVVEVPAEGDLDDLLGELTEEPVESVEEAPADDLLADLVDDAPEEPEAVEELVEEKGLDVVEASAEGDLDDLLGELTEEPVEVAEEPPADDLLSEFAEDDLSGEFLSEEPEIQPSEDVVEDDDVADLDLDALADELSGDAEADLIVETPDVPAIPPVKEAPVQQPIPEPEEIEIVEAPPGEDYVDDMSLDSSVFNDLVSEARGDIAAGKTLESEQAAAELPPENPDIVEELVQEAESTMGVQNEVPAPTVEPIAVDMAPEVVIAEPEPMTERDRQVTAFETAERLKRIAAESHAIESIRNAEQKLAERDFLKAIVLFEEALEYLPKRADLIEVRRRARNGLGGAYYLRSLSLERMGELEKAKAAALNAVKYGYEKGENTVRRIQATIDEPPPPEPTPPTLHWEMPDYVKRQDEIAEWLKRGRQAYLAGDYDEAILDFESVLARDPENKEAIRLTRSAAQKKYDRSSAELDATRTRMIATVRDTWNPRQYGLHEAPIDSKIGIKTDTSVEDEHRTKILEKMNQIRIPEVDFRQANIRDVVDFLHSQSVEFDPSKNPDERKGVNIILKLDQDSAGADEPAAPLDPFAAPSADPFGGGGGAGGAAGEILVTFSALDITLKEALDIVVDVAGLKYRIRGSVVMILPENAAEGKIEHRMYDVLSTAITRLQQLSSAVTKSDRNRGGGGGDFLALEGSGDVGGEEMDLKSFFTEMGVEWPANSSIKFVRGLGKLVVANTLENLTVFEKVLSILNVVPYQIEIEARFVEVAQSDVDSLGLEWLLNDNWELAHKKASAGAPLNAQERIIVNSGNVTRGNRFLDVDGVGGGNIIADDILSLSSVLTNPELSVVLHALQQRGHTDLLSAPKITTQSGQQATIKVVTEYIYPTEFETEGIGGGNNNAAAGNNQNNAGGNVGAVVTPGSFETREVGVILEVMPEVSPEGQMINLTLSPEVVSEPEWRNFGSEYTSYDPNGNPVTQELNMEQPFFHTRSLRTNLLIYNGATVVMGGMITEVRTDVDDKVPLLGDIPLLGRLFRSRYESSEKRNLLIFVTARLVDPSGRALDSSRFGVDKSIAERLVGGGEDNE